MEMETDISENGYKGKEMLYSKEEQNFETDVEVDLEEELICALSEVKKFKKKNYKQKE
jgi:hypothetical protein